MNKRFIFGITFFTLVFGLFLISPAINAGNGNELYITSDKRAESTQGVELSDRQLITLFNVASNYNELLNGKIIVEHDIDFNTPGVYNIKFIASYQEVLCFDDKDDADGNGTGKKDEPVIGTYCQNNADDGEVGDNDRYKYIDKQKVETAKLEIVARPPAIELFADNSYSDYEHTTYSKQQLIDLYNLEVLNNTTNLPIEVTHNIDFETPGIYKITFKVDEVTIEVSYEVIDLKPMLTANSEFTINLGDPVDFMTDYNVNASEFTDYDLNKYVRIHDEHVDYNTPGDYQVNISVSDHEGNIVIKNVILHIVDHPALNSRPVVVIKLGTELTDQQIINRFELTANYDLDKTKVTVDDNINFGKVGDYTVTFTDPIKGTTTTSILKIVEDIEQGLHIEKICTPVGDVLTKQDYIDAYATQVGAIKDPAIIQSLEIDDSLVDYYTAKTYQINVKATNSEGTVLNRVFVLCVTDDRDEEESEVDSEVDPEEPSEVSSEEPSEVDSEVDPEEPSEVSSEEPSEFDSEVDPEEPSEVDPEELGGLVCLNQRGAGKPSSVISTKIRSVQMAPSDNISDSKLRNLFGQPGSVSVIHNIIPDKLGVYEVVFGFQDCTFTGKVTVAAEKVIDNKDDLDDFLNDNGLNNLDPDDVKEGSYHVTVIDPETDEEKQMTIVYNLANTGGSGFWILIGLTLIASGFIIIKKKLFS